MTKPKVYVTRPLPTEALRLLKERCDVEMKRDSENLSKKELLEKLKKYDAILVSGTKIDEEICEAIQFKCKILANYGVGYDNIDVDAATKYGIYVSNNPNAVTEATADLAWGLILATARRIVECDQYIRSGQKNWGPINLLGSQVSGKTIGIIGGGRIGTAVGQRAKGFNMNIIYTGPKPKATFEEATGGKYVDKETLLREADFVSIHVPLLSSTKHLIGTDELKLMKDTAILINTSRGSLIDEKALVKALHNNEIGGAGLDVFEQEPVVERDLLDIKKVVLTPHVGTSTLDTRIEMGETCARNIFSVLDGKAPPNCVVSIKTDEHSNSIREDALIIVEESIKAVLPEAAVIKALQKKDFTGNTVVVAIGKAAWNMANATKNTLGDRVSKGVVMTKYEHSKGPIEGFEIIEAGHPVPDENSIRGTNKALELVGNLTKEDDVIFLISGGGSSIFEKPMEGVDLEDIMDITNQLLGCGADIVEINTVRKRLSAVKGGKFASLCGDASIYAIVLSDVIGDRLDSIASGPAYPDSSTSKEALDIINRYKLEISDHLRGVLNIETPKTVDNCETVITGSVSALCQGAVIGAQKLGYKPMILSSTLDCEAKDAGKFMAAIAREIKLNNGNQTLFTPPCAIIVGGETVVRLLGNGKGGRNQELALSAALGIEGLEDVVIFSVGSDGTDGPTDAAGGIVEGTTAERMRKINISPEIYLDNNDSYHALKASGDLIITGSTGTNVNDIAVLLCR
ncbi:D-isomer specific 2-hydroxyacid dehydrogenase, NAD-binding [Alkaliphilus metalliredigens QYMF]|uniref:D-isomer specific 2-hydroxyacid dehydrogenase, NAD-binding n=1 Tax=Alkaliphilus metalliredigens (strain QYMF) TaxID=293826 RepID=A6TL35_ALKMQ|nr:DUF4147 domain-containing protein [Alkaliphilus metalliredigens]ABR46903.1 D-isomer specific 2-hydroxyacid dehydrogenase, NAD-binding [Alkaliphilus metalliredigens QYMF]